MGRRNSGEGETSANPGVPSHWADLSEESDSEARMRSATHGITVPESKPKKSGEPKSSGKGARGERRQFQERERDRYREREERKVKGAWSHGGTRVSMPRRTSNPSMSPLLPVAQDRAKGKSDLMMHVTNGLGSARAAAPAAGSQEAERAPAPETPVEPAPQYAAPAPEAPASVAPPECGVVPGVGAAAAVSHSYHPIPSTVTAMRPFYDGGASSVLYPQLVFPSQERVQQPAQQLGAVPAPGAASRGVVNPPYQQLFYTWCYNHPVACVPVQSAAAAAGPVPPADVASCYVPPSAVPAYARLYSVPPVAPRAQCCTGAGSARVQFLDDVSIESLTRWQTLHKFLKMRASAAAEGAQDALSGGAKPKTASPARVGVSRSQPKSSYASAAKIKS